jgi:hypothetical protein
VTEQEWLACLDLHEMLRFLNRGRTVAQKLSIRKGNLFGAACCGHVRHLLKDGRCQQVLATLEQHADDPEVVPAGEQDAVLRLSEEEARVLSSGQPDDPSIPAAWAVLNLGHGIYGSAASQAAVAMSLAAGGSREPSREIEACLANLVRDIFGNPFRPVSLDSSWFTSTVVSLAAGIYADRAFDLLPIMADALQDAGCDNEEVLEHCRGGGVHVRGCWVVDLVLGKE